MSHTLNEILPLLYLYNFCTMKSALWLFWPFSPFLESITCLFSMWVSGSTPAASTI